MTKANAITIKPDLAAECAAEIYEAVHRNPAAQISREAFCELVAEVVFDKTTAKQSHLSPEAVAWVRKRIALHNDCERSPIKSISLAGADRRRDLIDLLVMFTGADREQLLALTKESK